MITAVDTNILLDILIPDDKHLEKSKRLLDVRQHILSDFIIGAHAINHAELLLSRDRGFS